MSKFQNGDKVTTIFGGFWGTVIGFDTQLGYLVQGKTVKGQRVNRYIKADACAKWF
jgi:preprotein translocase subunit YajC